MLRSLLAKFQKNTIYNDGIIYKLGNIYSSGCSGKIYINHNYAIKEFHNKKITIDNEDYVLSDDYNNTIIITRIINMIYRIYNHNNHNNYNNHDNRNNHDNHNSHNIHNSHNNGYMKIYNYFVYNKKQYYIFELFDMDMYSFSTLLSKQNFIYKNKIINFKVINEENEECLSKIYILFFNQIFDFLKSVSYFNFIHSDLKTKNILVKFKNKNILHNFKTCDVINFENFIDNLVFKISDFDKASITFNNKRYRNIGNDYLFKGPLPKNSQNLHIFNNLVNMVNFYDIDDHNYIIHNNFKLPNNIHYDIIPIRYGNYPFYNSFDIYSLVLSMLFTKIFYDYIKITSNANIIIILYELFGIDFNIVINSYHNYHCLEQDLNNDQDKFNNEFNNIIKKMEEITLLGIKFKKNIII